MEANIAWCIVPILDPAVEKKNMFYQENLDAAFNLPAPSLSS